MLRVMEQHKRIEESGYDQEGRVVQTNGLKVTRLHLVLVAPK